MLPCSPSRSPTETDQNLRIPNDERTYPRSPETAALLAKPLDRAQTLRVFRDNPTELFHFDRAVLAECLPYEQGEDLN